MSANNPPQNVIKNIVRTVLGLFFIFASTFHFTAVETEMKIIPPFLPLRKPALYITGLFELLGGYGLLLPRFQRSASWGLAALLVTIAPANIYHAFLYFKHGRPSAMRFYHYSRMPLQVVLILLTLWSGQEHKTFLQDD